MKERKSTTGEWSSGDFTKQIRGRAEIPVNAKCGGVRDETEVMVNTARHLEQESSEWAPGQLSDEEVNEIVERLCRMRRDSALALAIDVGALVVEKAFRGRVSLVRGGGRRTMAYWRLAMHPRMPFCRVTLWRYVRVYEVVKRLPWVVGDGALTVNHVLAVLSVPPGEQDLLLRRASRRRLTATQLRTEVRASEAGAYPARSAVKQVRKLARFRFDVSRLGDAESLNDNERERVRNALREVRGWCDMLEVWLGQA